MHDTACMLREYIFLHPLVQTNSKPFIFSGTLEINCSKDIKIQGVIGPCSSLEKVIPGVLRRYFFQDVFLCLVNK